MPMTPPLMEMRTHTLDSMTPLGCMLHRVPSSKTWRTRVCDRTATILSIFVAQSSRAGHQLTAAYDG
jgi:hypothetical protein